MKERGSVCSAGAEFWSARQKTTEFARKATSAIQHSVDKRNSGTLCTVVTREHPSP